MIYLTRRGGCSGNDAATAVAAGAFRVGKAIVATNISGKETEGAASEKLAASQRCPKWGLGRASSSLAIHRSQASPMALTTIEVPRTIGKTNRKDARAGKCSASGFGASVKRRHLRLGRARQTSWLVHRERHQEYRLW